MGESELLDEPEGDTLRGRCVGGAGVGGETTSTADLGGLGGVSRTMVREEGRAELEELRRGMRGSGEPALFECREKGAGRVDMTGDSTVAGDRLAMDLISDERVG